MALENAESTFGDFARGNGGQPAPDSGPLRVSLNTQFESGIPPARVRDEGLLENGIERMEMALASVTRTEANLGLLIRGLKHLAAGALAAREANAELTQELDQLRTDLTRRNEAEHSLRFRLSHVEQLLDVVRHEGAREREFLIEQQDLFLVEILTDHERQVADLQRALVEGPPRPVESPQQREIEELTAQRDQARDYALRCERERDAAWSELAASETTPAPVTVQRYATPAPERSLTPPPLEAPAAAETDFSEVSDAELFGPQRKSSATAIGSISLRAVQVPASHVSGTQLERAAPASGANHERVPRAAHASGTNHERASGTNHERTSPGSSANRERLIERPGTGYSVSGEDLAD